MAQEYFTAHTLRHNFAKNLVYAGTLLDQVAVLLAHTPKRDKAMVAASVQTLFVMVDRPDANQRFAALERRYLKADNLLVEAEVDILAYMDFPRSQWRRIYSTNSLERLNNEIKRRNNVVGVFSVSSSVIRPIG